MAKENKIKNIVLTSGMILIAIVVLFEVVAGILPDAITASSKTDASTLCTVQGCTLNSSYESNQCRTTTNDTLVCAAGGSFALPLSGLWTGSSSLIFLLISISVFIAVILLALKISKKK